MLHKFEAVGIFACVGLMAFALFWLRLDQHLSFLNFGQNTSQKATVIEANASSTGAELPTALRDSMDLLGNVNQLVIDDVSVGTGAEVISGDTVTVNYIGTLQNGQQFDNSYTKGTPFTFKVGDGKVIKGWDQGLVGMKVGGQRILVVPADLAYGAQGAGPISSNATLVFAIELVKIN